MKIALPILLLLFPCLLLMGCSSGEQEKDAEELIEKEKPAGETYVESKIIWGEVDESGLVMGAPSHPTSILIPCIISNTTSIDIPYCKEHVGDQGQHLLRNVGVRARERGQGEWQGIRYKKGFPFCPPSASAWGCYSNDNAILEGNQSMPPKSISSHTSNPPTFYAFMSNFDFSGFDSSPIEITIWQRLGICQRVTNGVETVLETPPITISTQLLHDIKSAPHPLGRD